MENSRKTLIKTYYHMKDRCYSEKDKRFADWGGRGIKICDEWLNDRESFIQWSLANGYREGLSIDRIDNDGDYSPNNCRWVSLSEQNQNRRSSKYYTFNGETKNLQQWCDEYGISRSMVDKRLSLGWDFEKAITTPKKTRKTDDIIGNKIGRLTVLEYVGTDNNRQSIFECRCDCGNIIQVGRQKLKDKHTQSCGCLRKDSINKVNTMGLNIHSKGE